jgi:hypothetical protein
MLWLGEVLSSHGCERKVSLLLIDIYRKFFNTNENGHLETGGFIYWSERPKRGVVDGRFCIFDSNNYPF